FTFLILRFTFVIALMLPAALLLRARWPRSLRESTHIAIAGMLLQGGYLGGVFAAIAAGMPAGIVALVVGLQPILTALAAAPLLKERTSVRQWSGLALGFGGVALVVSQKLSLDGLSIAGIAWVLLGLLSITAGTLYQKRFCPSFDLRTGTVIQFAAGTLLLLPLALLTETMHVQWTGEFVFALAWLVLVTQMDAAQLPVCLAVAKELRDAGIATEVALEGGKLGKQLKYADRAGIRFAVVAGEDELARGAVAVKDLRRGDQFEVSRAELVKSLRVELAQEKVQGA
ncbi:MAG TPA: His/Gly/Thr/Pro-type tRNA ligase C-terminal domain-containing protein, partial [Rhodanobacteraceae bacterium]|nr:His/Gly/Thr/Pro-type tRNA ligase C-terminal domain-containing protein [Rhodanobacteraceae bacterium]